MPRPTAIAQGSSKEDESNLRDPQYREEISEALYRGVARYAAHGGRNKVARAASRKAGS